MKKQFVIAIDLGGTNLKIALIDCSYKIKDRKVFGTRGFNVKEELIQAIVNCIQQSLDDRGLKRSSVIGVGLGVPGPVDVAKGIVHFFPNIPGWVNVNLRGILEKKLGMPVFLDNDANLMCLAESRLGAAKGLVNAVCLTLGTGVGGGLIIGGQLYRGSTFAAGEIGHIPINEKGPRCNCSGSACLEAYIGNNRIMQAARKVFKRNISLEELSSLAKKGNPRACALWNQVGTHLGTALVGVVNLLNPEGIVIGGGVAAAGEVLFRRVRQVIKKRAMSVQAARVKLFKARLGSDAGLIGAAIAVIENKK